MIVVGLMAVVHASDQFVREAQRVRKNYAYPLSSGRERKISVQIRSACQPKMLQVLLVKFPSADLSRLA